MADAIGDRKREMRGRMRRVRLSVPDPDERATRLWSFVRREPAVRAARTVMVYDAVPGEPDTASFIEWCREVGKHVVVPDADPDAAPPEEPAALDVVIVPGLAFTSGGDRLGQGGGWYDRVLARLRPDCATIGVCFAEQLVDELPTDDHDVRLQRVITDAGPA